MGFLVWWALCSVLCLLTISLPMMKDIQSIDNVMVSKVCVDPTKSDSFFCLLCRLYRQRNFVPVLGMPLSSYPGPRVRFDPVAPAEHATFILFSKDSFLTLAGV